MAGVVAGWAALASAQAPPPAANPCPAPVPVSHQPAAEEAQHLATHASPKSSETERSAQNLPQAGPPPIQGAGSGSRTDHPAEIGLEERLRRMEGAYRRMEESYRRMEQSNRRTEQNNLQLQAQYGTLLKRYDDLSRRVMTTGTLPARPPNRPASGPVAGRTNGSSPAPRQADAEFETASTAGGAHSSAAVAAAIEEAAQLEPRESQIGGAQGRINRTGPLASPLMTTAPTPSPMPFRSRMDLIGEGAQGTGGRTSPEQQPGSPIGARGVERRELTGPDMKPLEHGSRVKFAEGLEFTSEDEEFKLQFHNLTQAEFRGFPPRNQGILQSQFVIPRQRWYFTGELTKHIGFYTMIDHGYEPVDFYDMFISLRADERFKFRIGRMKTPYLYEDFSIAEGDLIAPERSMYAGNYSGNREYGAMFLGELLDNRLSYAFGPFNGSRKSYEIPKSSKDLFGYFQARPFLKSERFTALHYLNLGGSFRSGHENQPPYVNRFETANEMSSAGTASISPTFLALNQNVIDHGALDQWAADIVWFYKSFFFLAEYAGSRAGYGFANQPVSIPVNVTGYNVTTSYFLTGEQLTRRVNVVKPLRDFNFDFLKPGGRFSPGAIEVFTRFSAMDFSKNVFTAGLADPNLYTNHVWTTDLGANWYLNFYTRIYLDWQHAAFGNPVVMGSGKSALSTDIFWLRFQVFF